MLLVSYNKVPLTVDFEIPLVSTTEVLPAADMTDLTTSIEQDCASKALAPVAIVAVAGKTPIAVSRESTVERMLVPPRTVVEHLIVARIASLARLESSAVTPAFTHAGKKPTAIHSASTLAREPTLCTLNHTGPISTPAAHRRAATHRRPADTRPAATAADTRPAPTAAATAAAAVAVRATVAPVADARRFEGLPVAVADSPEEQEVVPV